MEHVNSKLPITIYENLPSGGARILAISNINYLSDRYLTYFISDRKYTRNITNLIKYLAYVYFGQYFANVVNIDNFKKSRILISYHSWVTKSPLHLRLKYIPQIYICHEPPREYYDKNYIKTFGFKEKIINTLRYGIKIIDRKNILKNDDLTIISNSIYSKNLIDKIYGVNSKIIYPGIKLSEYGSNNSYDKRKNIILCVGSINKSKNQLGLLRIIAKTKINTCYKVVFAGNGGDEKYIKSIIEYARSNNIKINVDTNLSRAKLILMYKSAKIFMYSPINEPFGIVVLEAMRAGLPIIANSYGGGYTEVLNSNTGKMISPNSYNIWEIWINKLLSDKKIWDKYSKYNYIYSEKYSEDIMNNKLELQIQKILSTNL